MRNFDELLPMHGHTFHTPTKGRWRAKVWLWPSPQPADPEAVRYQILFQCLRGPDQRVLKLWVYRNDLEVYHCQDNVLAYLTLWLESDQGKSEFTLRWDASRQVLYRLAHATS